MEAEQEMELSAETEQGAGMGAELGLEEGQELALEDAFEVLEGIVNQLESESITLEESFQVYQKGMKILKYCSDKIDRVEKKVLRINEDGQTDEF